VTLNNLLHGGSRPSQTTTVTFLTACGLDEQARQPWLAAWERVATAHLRHPASALRVRKARPRLLGVHAAIQIDGAKGELPAYVGRDLDARLHSAVTAAAEHGGFGPRAVEALGYRACRSSDLDPHGLSTSGRPVCGFA
jgi:hypothetical protein